MKPKYFKSLRPAIKAIGKSIEKRRFSEAPVFIGGSARAGTTLLLSILSAHEKLFCHPEEIGIFNMMTEKDRRELTPPRFYRHYKSLIYNKIPKTADRWCEKTPQNILHVETIDRYFKGNFKFIQIFRDGRDVILSKHPTRRDEYWVKPERWIGDVKVGIRYLDDPRVHNIHYEDLIADTEKVVRGICDFLELEYDERMANWHKYARVRRNKALYTSVQQISDKSIGKWKLEENRERAGLLMNDPEARELLQKLGYMS